MSNVEVPSARIRQAIIIVRGQRVILDRDLAELYRVEIRSLKQAARRNAARFLEVFMLVLTAKEFKNWRSQFVISNSAANLLSDLAGRHRR